MIDGLRAMLKKNLDEMSDKDFNNIMKDPDQRKMAKMIGYEREGNLNDKDR